MNNRFARTLFLTLLVAGALSARAQQRLYAVIDYMHIPEGKSEDAYIAQEKLWQRLHQKAVDTGICQGWYLDRVENGGRGDFATVRLYNSLDKLANPWPDSIVQGLYTPEELAKMHKTGESRDLIHSELLEVEASAVNEASQDPSTYLYVDFMKPKPGKGNDYYNAEMKTYKKIHEARVKAGEMKNWHFLSRMFPSGMDEDFDFVTVNSYAGKEQIWNPKTAEAALGKEEWDKLQDPTTIRTLVREEVWRPVLQTSPPAKDPVNCLGTWELMSSKYGDATEYSNDRNEVRHLKMITPTHFTWVIYDNKTSQISASMGGTYSLQGGTYTEKVEFFFPEAMKAYLGKEQAFTIKIDGDKLFQTGSLSDGEKIDEIWQRVK
jgi:hypothetical protein